MKKRKTLSLLVATLIAIAIGVFVLNGYIKSSGYYAQGTWYYADTFTLKDGHMTIESDKAKIEVSKDSICNAHITWAPDNDDKLGVLTLLEIKDMDENTVAWVSGDIVDAELEFEIAAGSYVAECSYFDSAEKLYEKLVDLYKANNMDTSELKVDSGVYDRFDSFGTEGTWKNTYMLDLVFHGANEGGKSSAVLIVGSMVIVIIVVVLVVALLDSNFSERRYDERQTLVQGKSFRYAFLTMICYYFAIIIIMINPINTFVEDYVLTGLGIIIGISVFVIYSLLNDAYFAVNEKKRGILCVFGVLFVLNLIPGIINIAKGRIFTNEKVNYNIINILLAVMMFIFFIVMIVKNIKDKHVDEIDEDDEV